MRPIHIAKLDKNRPVLVLTREDALPYLRNVTVVAITSRVRGLTTEVRLGPRNGLDQDCVANCDNIDTIPATDLGRLIGYLLPEQEADLASAIEAAFALE